MSVAFGWGMFAFGMICIITGAIIAYFIINKIQKEINKED